MSSFGSRSSAGLNSHRNLPSVKTARALPRSPRRCGMRFLPSILALEDRALLSTVTVTNTHDSGPGSLRDAITNATSGEVINFAKSAYGTIHLTSGPLFVDMIDLTIQGPGPDKLTISGGGNFTDIQFFTVLPPTDPAPPGFTPNNLSISGVTISDGNAGGGFGSSGIGGAILSFGDLALSNDVVSNNESPGDGGAIYSGGASLSTDHVLFSGNTIGSPSDDSDFQLGGAIFNVGGVANISASTFVNNQALGLAGQGGAIQTSFGSTLNVTGSTFINNQAVGAQYGAGGAIFGDPAFIHIDSSKFINNLAEGDSSFPQTTGGAIDITGQESFSTTIPATNTVTNSVFTGNRAVGMPGSGAEADGGAITSQMGTLVLSGSTFTGNQAIAGNTTTSFGGSTNGGAVFSISETLVVTSDTFLNNLAVGGSGPLGTQFAVGGAINILFGDSLAAPGVTSSIADSLFSGNQVVAGASGGVGTFTAAGAVGDLAAPLVVSNSTFLGNQAVGSQGLKGGAGAEADGGAIWGSSTTITINGGLIAGNRAIGGAGGDAPGSIGGAGGNGTGGGVESSSFSSITISGTTIIGNSAIGGAGGKGSTRGIGGNGLGGGIDVDGTSSLTITSGFVLGNLAQGGSGGGDGLGGGAYTLGTTTFIDTLVTLNDASGASGGGQGIGGGLYIGGGTTTLTGKTKVVANFASTSSDNVFGPFST